MNTSFFITHVTLSGVEGRVGENEKVTARPHDLLLAQPTTKQL
jgi:hypothetical protein